MPLNFTLARQCLTAFEFSPLFLEDLGWDHCREAFTVKIEDRDFRLTALGKKCGMVPDITGRVRAAFDVERVTKRFYDQFRKEKDVFTKFIEGIPVAEDRHWYASVMLNRPMFVYFIQRKGFLDGDPDYLRHKLERCGRERGQDKFLSFYRHFLLRLFHEGLGQRPPRKAGLDKLLGRIPYLNGGIFDVHQLEAKYGADLHIPDQAFARVFDYFDEYAWHLDERPLRNDKEINPAVLGFIFEKYVNQKQMGAYYTQEDITEYIAKSTIIPFLFDAARARCKVAFDGVGQASSPAGSGGVPAAEAKARTPGETPGSPAGADACPTVWDLLRTAPDRYIYPAVRHGLTWRYDPNHPNRGEPLATPLPLPPDIAAGLDTAKPNLIERRKGWNKPVPRDLGLPTEIWREVVARRQHYWHAWSRLTGREAPTDWVANPPTAQELAARLPASRPGYQESRITDQPPVSDINDFITLNLDLRQFAQDLIEGCEGPDLLMAFWQAITTITVLDPTGGSGAFLFAALNILEPLYEACLDRMEAFLAAWGQAGSPRPSDGSGARGEGRPLHPNYHKKFTEILARVEQHPNRRYFVLKSIVVNNLYAVDIMEEAVEICKLRLFLKLAAQVEPDPAKDNLGIEPLPDIDFNIRAGNTLVGYATADEVRRRMTEFGSGQMRLGIEDELQSFVRFTDKLQLADAAFRSFRQQQTELGGIVTAEDKAALKQRLAAIEEELNRYLVHSAGLRPTPWHGSTSRVRNGLGNTCAGAPVG